MSIQDKFNRANVIYKITKDIDLGGKTLTIPEGCTLDFQGGSFSNGTIEGNNTAIQAPITKIFGLDIELAGTWNVAEAYPEWLGAAPLTNSANAIKKCVETFAKTTFTRYAYIIEKTLTFKTLIGKEINSNLLSRGVHGSDEYTLIASNEFEGNSIIHVIEGSGIKFSNLKVKGLEKSENGIIGLELEDNTYSVTIDHCTFNFCSKGISLGRCWNLSFMHCIFNEDFYGIYTYGTMTSSTFMDCVFYTSERAIYFNGSAVYTSLIDCGFDGCRRGISVYSPSDINIINCGWEAYSEYGIIGNNADAHIKLYNSFILYQEGNIPFIEGILNATFYDTNFPNNFNYKSNNINFVNCNNVPYIHGLEAGQIDYIPIERLVTRQGATGFIQKGSKLVSVDEEITYMYDRTSSIIYNNYLLIEITIVADESVYNGNITVKANGFEISNPDYTSLFSFRKSDGSTESACSIRFLKNCRVIINAVGRGIRAIY